VYGLTEEGRKAFAAGGPANGKPPRAKARLAAVVAAEAQAEDPQDQKRQRRKEAAGPALGQTAAPAR
jgi:hypothetical protein